jgi:hypothetical protein
LLGLIDKKIRIRAKITTNNKLKKFCICLAALLFDECEFIIDGFGNKTNILFFFFE